MALVGSARFETQIKTFNDASQDWPADWSPSNIVLYSGQGFELPRDFTWINRPTGEPGPPNTGMLMGFPRSAEPQPNQDGSVKWYISES